MNRRRCLGISRLLSVALLIVAPGCGRYLTIHHITEGGKDFIEHEETIWITTEDGLEFVVSDPRAEGSQIVGMDVETGLETKIPFSEINSVQIREGREQYLLPLALLAGVSAIVTCIELRAAPVGTCIGGYITNPEPLISTIRRPEKQTEAARRDQSRPARTETTAPLGSELKN